MGYKVHNGIEEICEGSVMKSMLENAKRGLPFDDILIIDIHNHIGAFSQFNIPANSADPASHGYPINHKNYQTVYEIADEKKYPILIHVWGKDEVAIINRLASKYPGAQFIMGHGGAEARAMEDASEVINKYNNVYVDTAISMAPQGNIEWFVKESGSKKILFGTDMPFYDPRHTFGRVAMADISDDEKRDILG